MSKTSLYQKISKIVAEVDKVEKTGYNNYQKYFYITEGDLLEAVRKSIVRHGVLIFSSIDECTVSEVGDNLITTVRMKHTFADIDTGETHDTWTYGQGADKLDKGVYKAITGANKYFLLKNFLMSAGDDPESDVKGSPKPTAKEPMKAQPAKPQPAKKVSFGSAKPVTTEEVEF